MQINITLKSYFSKRLSPLALFLASTDSWGEYVNITAENTFSFVTPPKCFNRNTLFLLFFEASSSSSSLLILTSSLSFHRKQMSLTRQVNHFKRLDLWQPNTSNPPNECQLGAIATYKFCNQRCLNCLLTHISETTPLISKHTVAHWAKNIGLAVTRHMETGSAGCYAANKASWMQIKDPCTHDMVVK